MDRIPTGRIITIDTGSDMWGRVVYMVVNPPIVCETCDSVVFDWRVIDGQVVCPGCNHVILDRFLYPCPKCGENDYHTLRIVSNNNWHYDSTTGQITEYNDQRGRTINVCGKSLLADINAGRMRLLSPRESQDVKKRIIWTGSDDYDPVKPMPQSIIDQFPYSAQE